MRYKTFELYSQSYKGQDLPAFYSRISSEREIYWFKEITKTIDDRSKPMQVARGVMVTGKKTVAGKDNYSLIQLLITEDSEWFNFDIIYRNFKYRNTDALVALCKIIGWI